jgi:hypothetical protein
MGRLLFLSFRQTGAVGTGSGSSVGTSTVAAVGAALAVAVGGACVGTSTASAGGQSTFSGVGGACAGTAVVTGTGRSTFRGVGACAASATATGIGRNAWAAVGGACAGTSTATARGYDAAGYVGLSDGTSTVLGVGASLARASGASAGTSLAAAVGAGTRPSSGVGLVVGTSTATAISSHSAGLSVGTSTARGYAIVSVEDIPEVLPTAYTPPPIPPVTLDDLRRDVLYRLGDATASVWTREEIERYLEQGYLELATAGRPFWDQTFLENLPAGFSQNAVCDTDDADFFYGIANYTCVDERRLLDELHRTGWANHTCPDEATDAWLTSCGASADIPATSEVPELVIGLERATWDTTTITALSPATLAQDDTRYQITAGEVFGYTWRQDGARTFRKVRAPAAQAASYACQGSWGILRSTADITATATTGSRGVPRRIPTQHPIGVSQWGLPRRVYQDGCNVKIEHWRTGRPLDDAEGSELPPRYTAYLRDYAQAKALSRVGPGQDNILAKHYWARWVRGLGRLERRRVYLQRPRVGILGGGASQTGGRRPPRPQLPWSFGRTLR